MNKFILFVIFSILLTLVACEDNNSSSNTEITTASHDVESDGVKRTLSNGEQQEIARFMVYSNEEKEIVLSLLQFRLIGIGSEDEELEFYDALDNFQFIINNEDFIGQWNSIIEWTIGFGLQPTQTINQDNPVEIIVLADINSTLPKIQGELFIDRVDFAPSKIGGIYLSDYDPCLGFNGCQSALNDVSIERITKYAKIEIINEEIEEEECENCIYYDVEARITENTVSNGSNRLLSRFEVFVNHNYPEDIFLKGIKFRLTGSGENEEEELAFYDALDDFYFIINGEIVEAFQETATTISLQPMVSIDMENTVMIEMRVANVNATLPEIHGVITVENILLGDINQIGQDTKNWEEKWDPNLGQSNATCIIELIDGWMAANWQRAEINIVNDDIDYTNYDIETSTEIVSLQNGLNQSIATFTLFVESNRNDIHFHQVNFSLSGFNTEEEELEFYDALDNFTVIINDQEIVPAVDTATLVIPQFSVLVNGPVTIELRADVYSTYQNLRGTIRVDRVFLNHPRDDGMGIQYPENMLFKPELGNALGHTTAIYQTVNGGIPGWRFPDITIN